MEIAAMTYNLRIDVEQDGANAWTNRIPESASPIAAAKADVVGTQELSLSMLLDLEPQLADYAWVGEGRLGGDEGEFNAIFYRRDRWTALESGSFGLSERPDRLGHRSWGTGCPRMCTWVRLREKSGEELLFFNTHLDHISEEARRMGMRLIVERMEAARRRLPIPIVLTGDFNCEPDAAVHEQLTRAGFVNAYAMIPDAGPGRTYHGFQGGEDGSPIDYVYFTPDLRARSVDVDRNRYNGKYPSDHYPVTVRLES